MRPDRVKIEQMQLNIPGLSQEAANILGRDVVRRVGQKLPAKVRDARLASLQLKVDIPQGTPRELLAEIIAEQICRGLQ